MSIALYTQEGYAGVPTVLRVPNDDQGSGMGTCVAVPSGVKPKSYQLVLNPDGTASKAKPACTYAVFFPDSTCMDVVTDAANPTQATGYAPSSHSRSPIGRLCLGAFQKFLTADS